MEVGKLNAVGVVVEYNPFHNGHMFHLNQAKNMTNADLTIGVMSGNFLQRGEPALVDKWTRTAMALKGGLDLVVELPFVHAVQKAEIFAEASILILEEMGCKWFCFGSEEGNINPFIETSSILSAHQIEVDKLIKQFISKGYSYPKASALAYQEIKSDYPEILSLNQPNNILGYHYVSTVMKHQLAIEPLTIKRTGSGYHDLSLTGEIASATGIRKEILENENLEGVASFIPTSTLNELENYFREKQILHSWQQYWPLLRFKLISTPASVLANIYEMKEGLENRLIHAAEQATSFQGFMEAVKTKRYTWTRIQRILTYVLLNATKEEMTTDTAPPYLRILGFTGRGQQYLQSIKKEKRHSLITRLAGSAHPLLDMDNRATAVHSAVLQPEMAAAAISREYRPPIILM